MKSGLQLISFDYKYPLTILLTRDRFLSCERSSSTFCSAHIKKMWYLFCFFSCLPMTIYLIARLSRPKLTARVCELEQMYHRESYESFSTLRVGYALFDDEPVLEL